MCAIAATELPVPPLCVTASEGPELIAQPASLKRAALMVERIEIPQDTRAIIVAGFGDPGAAELARRLRCPVIGIGAASIRAASRDGVPFGIVTTTPDLERDLSSLVDHTLPHSQSGLFVGNFFAKGDPLGLMATETGLDDALAEAIERAMEAGAQRVVIGGGPLGAAAERLRSRVRVPLINPIRSAAREVVALLEQAHS